MTSYRPHPDDEWIDVTLFGSVEPQYVLGRSGAECELALAREKYVEDQLTLEQFESVLERWLQP
jgi:hypothetical protein